MKKCSHLPKGGVPVFIFKNIPYYITLFNIHVTDKSLSFTYVTESSVHVAWSLIIISAWHT